jgi:hypothetical protein
LISGRVANRLPWRPDDAVSARVEHLARVHRAAVHDVLAPAVTAWYPKFREEAPAEFDKMIELSTKMTLVGHACAEIAGASFEPRAQRIAALYGGCCFLADSFIDNFGDDAARDYLQRFDDLFLRGWFEIRNDREQLFYILAARLFAERDMLEPMVRQATLKLHAAQSLDALLRIEPGRSAGLTQARRRALYRRVARDRGGHTILLLTVLVAPRLDLRLVAGLFSAGSLFMYIDDHGDFFTDRREGRVTYMNQLRNPEAALHRIVNAHLLKVLAGIPCNSGRDVLLGILTRYYLTRIGKHRVQRVSGGTAWDVYE